MFHVALFPLRKRGLSLLSRTAHWVALGIIVTGTYGCTTFGPALEEDPFSYPANWPAFAYGAGKYDCPEITGTYDNESFATASQGSDPSPLLSELFTLLAANQPLDGERLWDPIPDADSVTIHRDPTHVDVGFLGDTSRKDSLQFIDPHAAATAASGKARHRVPYGKRFRCSHERLEFDASPSWVRGNPFPDRYLPDKTCPNLPPASSIINDTPFAKWDKPWTPRKAGQAALGGIVEVALNVAFTSMLECPALDVHQMYLYLGHAVDGSLVVLARINPGVGPRHRDYWYRYASLSATGPD